ncbi:MAG: hypothetical protein ACRERX_04135 [Pseudomonas sp.]
MFQRVSTLAGAALLAAGAIGLTHYWQWPTDTPVPVAPEVPAAMALEPIVIPPVVPALNQAAAPGRRVSQPLVPGRADTEIDAVPRADAAGYLVFALSVRDYFDYFLSFAKRAWQQCYAGYSEKLLALKASGLAAANREREIERLRQRLFDAECLHRVETYDAIAAKQEPSASSGP